MAQLAQHCVGVAIAGNRHSLAQAANCVLMVAQQLLYAFPQVAHEVDVTPKSALHMPRSGSTAACVCDTLC
jgi:hypothetical protein